VTNPAGLTLRVATGGAIVDGLEAYNTADVDFATTDDGTAIQAPGGGSNFYRVVLRKDWAAQTIRLAVLDVNVVAPAAVTQVDGTTWEISLATVEIEPGPVVTVTDTRRYVPEIHTEMVADDAITTPKIDDDAVTTDKTPDRTRRFLVPCVDGNSAAPLDAVVQGWEMPDAGTSEIQGWFKVPEDFASGLTVTAVANAAAGAGDVYADITAYYGAVGEPYNQHSTGNALARAVTTDTTLLHQMSLASIAAGDYVRVQFQRGAGHGTDTLIGNVYVPGIMVQYTADS